MPIALAVALLLAQAAHPAEPPRGEVQEQKPLPVPESEKPRATGHGVTLGKQEAAPGAHEARQHGEGEGKPGEAHEEGGVAEHIFHHVADEVWVPLGFWIGAHHIDLSITKHVITCGSPRASCCWCSPRRCGGGASSPRAATTCSRCSWCSCATRSPRRTSGITPRSTRPICA